LTYNIILLYIIINYIASVWK